MRGARVSVSQPRTLLSRQTVATSRRHHTDSSSLHSRCVYPPIALFCNDTGCGHREAMRCKASERPSDTRKASFDRKGL